MCGNVICGRYDTSKPFFTENGSFWTNSTTELLATTTDADRLAKTRNRCNTQGYESLALIPLHVGEKRLGLLQLNDQRKEMLSADKIAFWECLASYLAIALEKFIAEQKLKEVKDNLELKVQERTEELKILAEVLENVSDAIISTDENFLITSWNLTAEKMYGWIAEEVIGKNAIELLQTECIGPDNSEMFEYIIKNSTFRGEIIQKARDGTSICLESTLIAMKDENGNITGYTAVNRDNTEKTK
jgi:PAS domain S-box-containing protein